jgi:hypothetical protein
MLEYKLEVFGGVLLEGEMLRAMDAITAGFGVVCGMWDLAGEGFLVGMEIFVAVAWEVLEDGGWDGSVVRRRGDVPRVYEEE